MLFDIGAVQLRLHFEQFYDRAARIVSDRAEFKREYAQLDAAYMKLNGPNAKPEFLLKIKKLLGHENFSDENIKELVASAWGNPIDEILAVKSKVKEKYTIGNFSNITSLHLEMLGEKFPQLLEGCLDFPSLYSCRAGATKAEPKIYEQIQGYSPIIFIDDNETYVRNAVAAGWKGIWLTSYIDQFEAVRLVHTAASATPTTEFKIVDSVQGLEQALREYGIRI